MRVIHEDGRTADLLSHEDGVHTGILCVNWDGDRLNYRSYVHSSKVRPLGPIEDELLRVWGLLGEYSLRQHRDIADDASEAIEAARWLEDPKGNAAELARAREMGAIR
jgi:hypothetical protein